MEYQAKQLETALSVEQLYTAFLQTYDADFVFAGESHDMWELNIFLSGKGGVTSETNLYECEAGEVVIHGPGHFHTFRTENTETTVLTISFNCGEGWHLVPKGKFILNARERALVTLLSTEIELIYGECNPAELAPFPIEEQIIKGMLESLLLMLARRRNERAHTTHGENETRFSEIASFLKHNVCLPFDLDGICASCHIGRSALKALFRRYAGMGVMQYFNHLRVSYASKCILSGMPMAQIAREMNFSSQNYFSAFFKRETGLSPRLFKAEKEKTARSRGAIAGIKSNS